MESQNSAVTIDGEVALAARAAWLHFSGGKTQGEVAQILGIANTKAHRLIARARSEGLVRVYVDGPMAGCIELEEKLKNRFGLKMCEVVPNIDFGALPLATLGAAGERFIRTLIESQIHRLVGVGHGRTLAAAVNLLPNIDARQTKFVSLLGGLTRRFSASPFDVMHRLAERTGAEAYVMPVPFFANTIRDKKVLAAQYGVSDVITMTRDADLYIAGIGEVDRKSFIATADMVEDSDVETVLQSGASAEILGHFFSAEGKHVENALADRAMAPSLADLQSHKIVALAGGASKTKAIAAILLSKLLHGLITDEETAKRLVAGTKTRPHGSTT